MIRLQSLTLQRGPQRLLEDAELTLHAGHKAGLIGANGAGKSSLFALLRGELTPDAGDCLLPADWRIAHMRQEVDTLERLAVDYVLDGDERLREVQSSLAEAEAAQDGAAQARLHSELDSADGYTADARARKLLAGLGFTNEQMERQVGSFSGGWRMRLNLAQALMCPSDLLLLDEPTNHLDINTIRWLENILTQRNSLMIIISHDRHFLNSVCTHMADLDYGELRLFPGNYDEYMTVATQSREQLLSDNAKKKAQISELQSFVSRFSANASKAKQATSRAKAIDKIQLAEVKPSSRVSPFIRFEQTKKLHRQAVIVDRMAKGFDGKTLFKDFSFQVEAGERVAIIGPNGIGKTTLLRTLVNELQPDAGTVKWTDAAEIGYYAQDHAHDFEDDSTLFDWMGQWTQGGEQLVRGTLGRMLFSNDEILKSVKVISGGEQGRMLFGKLILQKPNVLVMDEPTNHLDMESIESLNLALENYPGTLIFVSHDREFVSSLATRIIELSPSGVVDFSGTYDDYLRSQGVTF
ncbi:ABC-F family ATPase [Pseudomonas syringae]|uniref:ABC-F family ATPase n=1 Tax=Pseudomonas syringae TaxID=317 RepID=UPI000E3295F5|nr:ABC-F family ATPase [Pseudomonas syringae]